MTSRHIARYFAVTFSALSAAPAAAAGWICTYPDFSEKRAPVIVRLNIEGDMLIDDAPPHVRYKVLTNNANAVIAAEAYAELDDPGSTPRVYSSTIIIDKVLGRFLYSVIEINQSPGFREGRCINE
jgi:hypothetical protein